MNAEETRALWVRFIAGEALSGAEQAGLVAALEADGTLRAELLEDVQLDGALRALADARRDGEAFAAQVAGCLGAERDATRFIRKVEERLAEPPTEPSGSRDTRTGLPRVSRRFLRRSPASGSGWKAALVAASALFGILLLATAFSGGSRPAKPANAAHAEPLPADPVAPPQTAREPRRLAPPPKRTVEPTPEPEYRDPQPLEVPPPKAPDTSAAKSSLPPAPLPAPAPTRSAAEAVIVRGPKIESVFDQVYFAKGQTRPAPGAVLDYGQDLYTRGRGKAVLKYDDGTAVELGPDSMVRDLSDARGRRLLVSVGVIESDIRKQPEGRPMVFSTPHAEATILGTKIRLTAGADPKTGSTLEVREGRVRFTRLSDGAATDVEAGRAATASASQELKLRVPFPDTITINFGPADLPKSPAYVVDSGEPFSPARGYGWDGSRDGQVIPGAAAPDGSPVLAGRNAGRRQGALTIDDPRATEVAAGWGEWSETWKIELPNGWYLVSVCVGDPTFEQGPHHVAVEGKQLIDQKMTRPPSKPFLVVEDLVEVKDGELAMKVGGYPGTAKSVDNSKDTILNYLVIKRVPAKK